MITFGIIIGTVIAGTALICFGIYLYRKCRNGEPGDGYEAVSTDVPPSYADSWN